jgi:hypothetical protein
VRSGSEPGHGAEAAGLQAGDQGLNHGSVLAGAHLEIQDHFTAVANEPHGYHDHHSSGQDHPVEHESEKLRTAQIAFAQFADLGGGGFDPVARSRALAHFAFAGPRMLAGAHTGRQRGDHGGGVVGGVPDGLITGQHMLGLATVGVFAAHTGTLEGLAPPFGVVEAHLGAGAPIERAKLWVVRGTAQGGDFFDEHLLGNAT